MVFRIASAGNEVLDLFNADDEFGQGDDVVVVRDSYGLAGTIATYGGDDVIVMNNLGSGFSGPAVAGLGNDLLYGGSSTDVLADGGGNDLVYAGAGNDEIFADRGNDYYDGAAGSDIIHFSIIDNNAPGGGTANTAGVRCDLALGGPQNFGVFGTDTLHLIENIFGGGGNDTFFGNDGANGIEGRGGNDLIQGRGGNDTLFAFTGSDTLVGGAGADSLILDEQGNAARDIVRYLALGDSGTTAATRDTVADFHAGTEGTADRIDLSSIDARPLVNGNQAFVFVQAFTNLAGEVRVVTSGGSTIVQVDTDSDAAPEMTIQVAGVIGLDASDFIL